MERNLSWNRRSASAGIAALEMHNRSELNSNSYRSAALSIAGVPSKTVTRSEEIILSALAASNLGSSEGYASVDGGEQTARQADSLIQRRAGQH